MKEFTIERTSSALLADINQVIDNKTKPIGALGRLEDIARNLCLIQQSLRPELKKPAVIVFAGDHGIAKEGQVNPYPQEVTFQMVMNFLSGGAAINVFSRQHGFDLSVVDAGVNYDFANLKGLVHAKISFGTRNYRIEPAMTKAECEKAIAMGAAIVEEKAVEGTNVIAFGEMGIGNTSSASLILHMISGISIAQCVGKGTGLNEEGLLKKIEVLEQVAERYKFDAQTDPLEILRTIGGYEIAMMCGAYLEAAARKMLILVDGFISTAALMIAYRINSGVLDYCFFSHVSDEQGHKKMLSFLEVQPIINFNMRLGEGTGAAVVYPLIQSAVAFMNEMASFDSANVSKENG